MSADVMERITALEREQRALCDQAAAESKQKLIAARRALERVLEDDRRISETEAHRMLDEADAAGAEETKRVLAAAQSDCDAIRCSARERLNAAAEFIIERVVSESWQS